MDEYKKYKDTYWVKRKNPYSEEYDEFVFADNNDFDEEMFEVVDGYYYENEADRPLSIWKKQKVAEIEQKYSEGIAYMIGEVGYVEMSSWNKQETEARGYLTNNESATPVLDILVESRGLGESIEELAGKIVRNADMYAANYADLLGKYHNRLKAVNSATSVRDVEAIEW